MGLNHKSGRLHFGAAAMVVAALWCGPAAAQQPAPQKPPMKTVTLSSLTAEGYEIKAVAKGDGVLVQKGKDVFWCIMHLGKSSPLSYQSECYAVH